MGNTQNEFKAGVSVRHYRYGLGTILGNHHKRGNEWFWHIAYKNGTFGYNSESCLQVQDKKIILDDMERFEAEVEGVGKTKDEDVWIMLDLILNDYMGVLEDNENESDEAKESMKRAIRKVGGMFGYNVDNLDLNGVLK